MPWTLAVTAWSLLLGGLVYLVRGTLGVKLWGVEKASCGGLQLLGVRVGKQVKFLLGSEHRVALGR